MLRLLGEGCDAALNLTSSGEVVTFLPMIMLKSNAMLLLCGCAGLCWAVLACQSGSNQAARIEQAVREELRLHPAATLQDLYKFFFQGAYGPGHMIPDPAAARRFLAMELHTSTDFDSVLWQPVGVHGEYVRVNLKLVKEGIIPAEDLLAAFVQSANAASPPALAEWQQEWQMILAVIAAVAPALPAFAEEKVALEQRLARGEFVGHHSEAYEQRYHPHYRLVSRAHFERLHRKFLAPAQAAGRL